MLFVIGGADGLAPELLAQLVMRLADGTEVATSPLATEV